MAKSALSRRPKQKSAAGRCSVRVQLRVSTGPAPRAKGKLEWPDAESKALTENRFPQEQRAQPLDCAPVVSGHSTGGLGGWVRPDAESMTLAREGFRLKESAAGSHRLRSGPAGMVVAQKWPDVSFGKRSRACACRPACMTASSRVGKYCNING